MPDVVREVILQWDYPLVAVILVVAEVHQVDLYAVHRPRAHNEAYSGLRLVLGLQGANQVLLQHPANLVLADAVV